MLTNRQRRERIKLASRHAAIVLNQVVAMVKENFFMGIFPFISIFECLYFWQVVEMVKRESLVEEAMQVVVEQELEVEELPAILQVDSRLLPIMSISTAFIKIWQHINE